MRKKSLRVKDQKVGLDLWESCYALILTESKIKVFILSHICPVANLYLNRFELVLTPKRPKILDLDLEI